MGFDRSHYDPKGMGLVVLGGESLDQLETWAKEMFSPVPAASEKAEIQKDYGPPFEVYLF